MTSKIANDNEETKTSHIGEAIMEKKYQVMEVQTLLWVFLLSILLNDIVYAGTSGVLNTLELKCFEL